MNKFDKLRQQLITGKTLRIRHPELNIYITAELKLQPQGTLRAEIVKISLPQKATKLEKLLLKFVSIYCYEAFVNNLYNEFLASLEYRKLLLETGLTSA